MFLHGLGDTVICLCLVLNEKFGTRLSVENLVTLVHKVVVDGFRDNGIVFILGMFQDEITHPPRRRHEATCNEVRLLNNIFSSTAQWPMYLVTQAYFAPELKIAVYVLSYQFCYFAHNLTFYLLVGSLFSITKTQTSQIHTWVKKTHLHI